MSVRFRGLLLLYHYALSISAQQQITSDVMSTATYTNWNFGGNCVIPSTSTDCVVDSCFELKNTGWVERTFSTTGYQDVYFNFYVHGSHDGTLDMYIYDSGFELSWINQAFTVMDASKSINAQTTGLWDDIQSLKIRFELNEQTGAFLDNFGLYGDPIPAPNVAPTMRTTNHPTYTTSNPTLKPTATPTVTPTPAPTGCYTRGPCNIGYMDRTNGNYQNWNCGSDCIGGQFLTDGGCNCACVPDTTCSPTAAPTSNTAEPSSSPSNPPSTNPTNNPSLNPTRKPTNIPTISPIESTNPTKSPSKYPTIAPTITKSDGAVDDDDDNPVSTATDTNNGDNDTKTSNSTENSYFMVGGFAIILLVITSICVIILFCKIKKRVKQNKPDGKEKDEIMSASSLPDTTSVVTEVHSPNATHECEIEMQQFSLPSTQVTPMGIIEHNNIQSVSNMNSMGSMHAMSMRQLMGESELKLDTVSGTGGEQVITMDDMYGTPTNTQTPEEIDDDDDDGLYENTDEYENENDQETKGNTLGGTTGGNESMQEVHTDSENTTDENINDDTNDHHDGNAYYQDDNTDKGIGVNENINNVTSQ